MADPDGTESTAPVAEAAAEAEDTAPSALPVTVPVSAPASTPITPSRMAAVSAMLKQRRRLDRPWWLAGVSVIALLTLGGVALAGGPLRSLGFAGLMSVPATATAAPVTTLQVPTAWPTPAPTPSLPTNATRNLAMGCGDGPPAPIAYRTPISWNAPAGTHSVPEVALTFDDGPTPYSTPDILSYLEKTHTPATFFVLGQYVHIWPYLLQREWNDGFALGVHTWDHPMLTRVPDSAMPHQLGDTIAAMHAAIGADACTWLFRPPYGDYSQHVGTFVMGQYGLTVIGWDIDSLDYTRPGPQAIANNVLSRVHPGSIVLMHDGPALREQTLAALPMILDGLRARGLKPVTLPQLMADEGFPGVSLTASYPDRTRHRPDV
ncbi:MAG TPA: polysaccharide deacetylase family protein [Ktedonobacterales bacterium]